MDGGDSGQNQQTQQHQKKIKQLAASVLVFVRAKIVPRLSEGTP